MSINILNLSQELSNNVQQNGQWETQLTKEIELNEGDEVSIKNVFIDTTQITTGKVVIPEDITLQISNAIYWVDWETTSKTYAFDSSITPPSTPTYDIYIASQYTSSGGGPSNLVNWQTANFKAVLKQGTAWGPYNVNYTYIDAHGVTQKYVVNLPRLVSPTLTYNAPVNLVVQEGSVTMTTSNATLEEVASAEYTGSSFSGPISIGDVFSPLIFNTEIDLDKGSYDPNNLCEILNNQLTDLKTSGTNLTNSSFLKSYLQIQNSAKNGVSNFKFINANANSIMTCSDTTYLIGASQIQLNYNNETQKFEWDYLHMPYYTNSGQIAIRYDEIGVSPTQEIKSTGRNAGIFFTNLSAVIRGTTKDYDFWSGDLGFNLSQLIPETTIKTVPVMGDFDDATYHTYNLITGLNVTDGFKGLDNIVIKNDTWQKLPSTFPLEASTDTTYPIYANNSLSTTELNDSHYLINIQAIMKNNFINEREIKGEVSGIVSRYYNYGSFTSGGTETAITYIHKGAPAYLKSFRVRITDKDFNVPEDIGDRNDIYLQIIKNI